MHFNQEKNDSLAKAIHIPILHSFLSRERLCLSRRDSTAQWINFLSTCSQVSEWLVHSLSRANPKGAHVISWLPEQCEKYICSSLKYILPMIVRQIDTADFHHLWFKISRYILSSSWFSSVSSFCECRQIGIITVMEKYPFREEMLLLIALQAVG